MLHHFFHLPWCAVAASKLGTFALLKANYLWPAVWGRAFAEDDPERLRVELVQVAAVALTMAAASKRARQ